MSILLIVLALLVLFIAVLAVRAVGFVPGAAQTPPPMAVAIDEDAATAHMQAFIQCPTVSYDDRSKEDEAAFEAFPALLRTLYPHVEATCKQERIGPRALMYRWPGKQSEKPSVFMAHYDVVPAQADAWQKPPFSGIVEDGILWGRGTLDTKGTLLSVMEAAEHLIAKGFVPAQDIYLCFGGNEEIGGDGAPSIVEALKARGVTPAFVLDEGGAVVENVFPGVKTPAALVGIGEKGQVNMTLRMKSKGGHASAPPPHTPVGVLAQAVTQVESHPFPFKLTPAASALFDTLGRHSTFALRLVFANLWCFAAVLNMICKKAGGEMNALVRTTCAFTQMSASDAANVMPPVATVGANLRIIGGESIETVQSHLAKTIGNPDVEVIIGKGNNPSPDSDISGEAWQRLRYAIGQTWPEAIISPYLMVAASDSRHYAQISQHVYRFCPMPLSTEERRLIHGNDERIPVAKLHETIRFYVRLMQRS